MYAVIQTGGKQLRVKVGQVVEVESLPPTSPILELDVTVLQGEQRVVLDPID